MKDLWESAAQITHTDPAGLYLTKTRALTLNVFPSTLRFTPQATTKENDELKTFPALLAKFTNAADELTQVQRIFLTDSGEKAPIKRQKKLMPAWQDGATRGGAIKLFPSGSETLGLAEGIETALAAHLLYGVPTWSCYNDKLLRQVQLPEVVRNVIIFADNDESGAGQSAAQELKARLRREGRTVKVLMPSTAGTDFADLLTELQEAKAAC
jgi:putative DNA primase/helicase